MWHKEQSQSEQKALDIVSKLNASSKVDLKEIDFDDIKSL